jgi:hypothetical protein
MGVGFGATLVVSRRLGHRQLRADSGRSRDRDRAAGVDPKPSLATSRAGGQGDKKAVIRVRLLVMLADPLMSVRLAAPLPLSDRRCQSPR